MSAPQPPGSPQGRPAGVRPPDRSGPAWQPVRLAIALAVISAVLGIGILLIQLAGLVLPAEQFTIQDPGPAMVLGAFLLAGALAAMLLGLAQLILGILVTVRGRGLLRRGAIIALVAWGLGISITFSASGDVSSMPAGVSTAASIFSVLGAVVELVRGALMLVGAAILLKGCGVVRRERAAPSRV